MHCWHDKNPVHVLSTADSTKIEEVKRKQGKDQQAHVTFFVGTGTYIYQILQKDSHGIQKISVLTIIYIYIYLTIIMMYSIIICTQKGQLDVSKMMF